MVRNASRLQVGDQDTLQRIREIIDEVIHLRSEGLPVDEAALVRQHADLMPELQEQLSKLKRIQAASDLARRRASSDGEGVLCDADLQEEQKLLEQSLADYRILHRLDYGGQGVIYRAVHAPTKRQVAIKVLLDGPLATERQRLRFEREVDLVARLRHPNIVTLYDSGVVRSRPYFAMEFVDGVPIDDYVLLHRPTVDQCVELFVQACRAVAYAHQRGIIHRDLKPSNILVDMEGRPHVLDFGLAKTLNDDRDSSARAKLSIPGGVLGTLPYLSPEQVDGTNDEVDVRSDIYSLGVVLYQLITGQFPYDVDGRPSEVSSNILHCEPMPLRKVVASDRAENRCTTGAVSDDLERVILKTLAKDPSRRYQSAAAFAADLERYLAGEAVEAKYDRSLYLLRKTIRRYRLQVAFSAAMLVVTLGSSVLVTRQWLKARAQRETAVKAVGIDQEILHNMVSLVIEKVGRLAGASEVRQEILQLVRDRYQELLPLVHSDEAMKTIEAGIHEQFGDMAHAEGRHAEAFEHYKSFLAISRGLPAEADAPHLRELDILRAHRKLTRVADNRVYWLEQGIQLGETLVARLPKSTEARLELCRIELNFAWHLHRTVRYADAVEHADTAMRLAESPLQRDPGDVIWTGLMAMAYEYRGRSRIKLGNEADGIETLEEARRLREALFDARPADVRIRHETLIACGALATAYRYVGRLEKAEELFRKAIEIGEYLTRVDPNYTAPKRDLISIHARLAKLYLQTDDLEQARRTSDAAVELARNLVSHEPDNVEWRRMQAFAYATRGPVRFKENKIGKANDDFVAALRIREALASSVVSSDPIRAEIAQTHDWLGKCSFKLKRIGEALDHHRQSGAIWASLTRSHPDVGEYGERLIKSRINLATCHMVRDTREDDDAAYKTLMEATKMVSDMFGMDETEARRRRIVPLIRAVNKNMSVIERRRARRDAGGGSQVRD